MKANFIKAVVVATILSASIGGAFAQSHLGSPVTTQTFGNVTTFYDNGGFPIMQIRR